MKISLNPDLFEEISLQGNIAGYTVLSFPGMRVDCSDRKIIIITFRKL